MPILVVVLGVAALSHIAPVSLPAVLGEVSSAIVIAGNGPELATMQDLAHAFEKRHLGTVVETEWDPLADPIKRLNSGAAQVAVSGRIPPNRSALTIAWDGIAGVVFSGNPLKTVTTGQLSAIFTGKMRRWSDLSGDDLEIQPIHRARNQQIRLTFEESLGIVGQVPRSARRIRSDQETMSTVAGRVSAVAYASLRPALDAVRYGVDISLLSVDGVEAAEETVKDGRYRLRRPVLLIYDQGDSATAEAFALFALSEEGQAIIGERFTPSSAPLTEPACPCPCQRTGVGRIGDVARYRRGAAADGFDLVHDLLGLFGIASMVDGRPQSHRPPTAWQCFCRFRGMPP